MFRKFVGVGAAFLVSVSLAQCGASPDSGNFGPSTLGTLDQPRLPPFLTNNPLPNGFPWGNKNPQHDDPKNPPHTGVTRYYDFTIARTTISPDGVVKPAILINGQNPGPTIEANWGDQIQGKYYFNLEMLNSGADITVSVYNNITGPEEGTSLHWHGLLQKDTPWMDGVPSVTQCPIAPGSSFTYSFRADVYGTSWYHSHFSAQAVGGLFGPIVIYGPTNAEFDEDLGVVLVSDYYHKDYLELVADGMSLFLSMETLLIELPEMSANATLQVQFGDNTVINGRMPFNCSLAPAGTSCTSDATYSKFRVQTGKTYKIRLVNPGAGSVQWFSIDNHELTIIANDFVDLVPYTTTMVTLGVGQRSDVLFTPKGNGSIWMRTETSGKFCGGARSVNPKGKAVILLDNAPDSSIPTTTPYPDPIDNGLCANDPLNFTVPYYPITLPAPTTTYNILINNIVNATGHKQFLMNGVAFQGDYNDPVLLLAEEKNHSYPYDPNWNVVNFGTNSSIRINVYNNNTSPHPMHLHGHDFFVLHDGAGPWDGVSIINPSNPQRRDTHNLAPFGHIVIQYNADNPGTWPFHCHIAWHLSQGLFMNFMESPEEINELQIPLVMKQTCNNWDAWTSSNVVDQIDSGLKKRGSSPPLRERKVRRRL